MATKKASFINYSPGKSLNVRLRGKRLSNGTISLFLDYYQGYTVKEDGKVKTSRKVEYLKIYLVDNPRAPSDRQKNDESITLAQTIRNQRESDIQHGSAGLVAPYRKKSNFVDYLDAYEKNYIKKDIRMIKSVIKGFKSYINTSYLTPIQVDHIKVRGFRDYLLNRYKGETPNSYFSRFKKILNAATEEGLFVRSPGEKITCKIPFSIPKNVLMPEEVRKLAITPCVNDNIKRAFLLSLNTGLRFVDIVDLKFEHIQNGQIKKPQQKTGREVIIDLNEAAKKLIGTIGKPEDLIFNLPTANGCNKTLKSWKNKAGIEKKITWHCARHSFATILLMNKTDIKTVGNLLGHSKLEHTQKYTHIVDQLKSQAVNTLPDLDI